MAINSKAGSDDLGDYISKNKKRARKSAEMVQKKLEGKRMIPDPSRKGCYIYVDAEEADREHGDKTFDVSDAVVLMQKPTLVSNKDFGGLVDPVVQENDAERKRLHLAGGECFSYDHEVVIVVHHPKPTLLGVDMSAIARVPETSLIGILMDGMKENEKPQENESHIVGGRYTLEEVEKLIGKKFPQENDVVDELDHVQKFGPSFGAYPVEDGESLFRFTGISPQDGKSMVAMERDLWGKGIRLGEEE